MSESDVLRIADKHGQRWKAPDEEGISFEKSAFFEFAEELLASRDAEVQRLREALDRLCEEFVRVFPVYYYAEPWAHDRNEALIAARAALKEQQ